MIEELSISIKNPLNCYKIFNKRKLNIILIVFTGLFFISRYISIAIDIHRPTLLDIFNPEYYKLIFNGFERGTFTHSIIVALCGPAFLIISSLMTSLLCIRKISKISNNSQHDNLMKIPVLKETFLTILFCRSVRIAFYLGIPLIIIIISGELDPIGNDFLMCIWICGLVSMFLDFLYYAAKYVTQYKIKGRYGVIYAFISFLVILIPYLSLIAVIGGFS